MAVRLIKKTWWVDFSFNQVRYRKRSPENSRAGAASYEAVLRQTLARGNDANAKPAPKPPLFKEFAETWFNEYVVANNRPRGQQSKKYVLRGALIPFFGNYALDEITARQIEQFKATQAMAGLANKTINDRLLVLNTCLKHAYEWELLPKPHSRIKRLKEEPPATDYLSQRESNLLLASAQGITHELILTALRTGMRQGELKALQWTSLDWEAGLVAVRHSRSDLTKALESTKSNRIRYVPLDLVLGSLLAARKRSEGYVFTDQHGHPFNSYRLAKELKQTCSKAGIRMITWHALRHTFATQLAMKGVPLNVVQTLLGHSTIGMTMRYAHVAPSALHAAIRLLGNAVEAANDNRQLAVNLPAEMPWKFVA